jgi:D-alanyl-D-alanine carboxypeptidase (penicillin-binding protein 5/6)
MKKGIRVVICMAAVTAFVLCGVYLYGKRGNVDLQETVHEQKYEEIDIKSRAALLIEEKSKQVLFSKNAKERVYPASLTKLMTAVVAQEHTKNADEQVIVSSKVFGIIKGQNASVAGFLPGETVRMRDLYYGMLLPSGADACLAAAEKVAGDEKRFVRLMNEKAKELGMEHTKFANVTGLHDASHYTTAEDFMILFRYAIKNETIQKVITSKRYSVQATNKHPEGFTIKSTLFQSIDEMGVENSMILGGKTGYTTEAGLCLASVAKSRDKTYLLITMGAEGKQEDGYRHIEDAQKIYQNFLP